jgi:hypothetical protein
MKPSRWLSRTASSAGASGWASQRPAGQVAAVGLQRERGQAVLDPQRIDEAVDGRSLALRRCRPGFPAGGAGRAPRVKSSLSFCLATTVLVDLQLGLHLRANCSGVLPMISEPVSSMRLRTPGSASATFFRVGHLGHHGRRRALGRQHAVVGHAVDGFQPHFLEGGHVGQLRQALRRSHHDGDQPVVLDEGQRRGHVVEDDCTWPATVSFSAGPAPR